MYLHIGSDYLLKKDELVALIDLEKSSKGQITEKFLTNIKNKKDVHYISEHGKEKTLIITNKGYFLSPISAATLYKRSSFNIEE